MKTIVLIIRNRFYLLLCFIMFANCSGNSNSDNSELHLKQKNNPQTYVVEIKQMAFVPSEISIENGDSVKFINHDFLAHDITEDSARTWTSSTLQPEQSWTREFNTSANYLCSLHPVMKGKVLVK